MAWFGETFGDGLSSIKGQITKITKDVLSEDPLGVSSFEGKVKELEDEIRQLKIIHEQELESRLAQVQEDSNKTIDDLENEHETALQIVIEERDQLRELLGADKSNLEVQDKPPPFAQVKKLKAQLAQKQQEVTLKHQETIKLRQELDSVKAELLSNQEVLNDFNDRLDCSENEGRKLYDQLLAKEEEIKNLQSKLDKSVRETDVSDAELQLEHAETVIKGLMEEAGRAEDIKRDFDYLKNENHVLKERFQRLEQQNVEDEKVNSLMGQFKSLETELGRKTLELESVQENSKKIAVDLKNETQSKNETILLKESLEKQNLALETELKNFKHEAEASQTSLKNQLEQKNIEMEKINEGLASREIAYRELELSLEESRDLVKSLENRLSDNDDFSGQLEEKESQLHSVSRQLADALKTIEDLESKQIQEPRAEELEPEFDEKISEELVQLQREKTELEEKYENMVSLMNTERETSKELEDQLRHEVSEWCQKYETVVAQLDRVNAEHLENLSDSAKSARELQSIENSLEVTEKNYLEALGKLEKLTAEKKISDETVEGLLEKLSLVNSDFDKCSKKLEDAVQVSESLQIKNEVLKHNLVSLEEQKAQLLQQAKNSDKTELLEELKNNNSDLLKKVEMGGREVERLTLENKEMREKVEKLGFGALAGHFEALYKRLDGLAQRMQPTAETATTEGSGATDTTQSQTDDVKRMRQDLATMTVRTQIIENGVNALESNISQWAAAVESRDQMIQALHGQIAESEGAKSKFEKLCEEAKRQSEEWEHRVRELQSLYETEVGRLETLCKEKDLQVSQGRSDSAANKDSDSSELNDQVTRLLNENTDLKLLVQQLRNSMLELNTRSTVPNEARVSPTPPQSSSGVSDAQHQALKERESSLSKELERLRAHLVEVEEHYTTEAMANETELAELRSKLAVADEQLRSSTTVYKSANIRATQHVESLNSQIQLITVQRNDLQAKLSDAEDEAQKQAAALASLQSVLEQFQLDKHRELQAVEERHKYHIELERRRIAEVESETQAVRKQLAEANNGLKAAARLGEQLDRKSKILSDCETELATVRKQLQTAQNQITNINQATSAKIDKSLIKNLVIGYLGASGEAKAQALRILTAVLELNEEERVHAGIDGRDTGWLSSLLHPSPNNNHATSESLSQAFVKFLETESRPQPQLRLLPEPTTDGNSRELPKRTPLVLSELVLPSVTPTPVPDGSIDNVLNNS